jgi:hypothetical protein
MSIAHSTCYGRLLIKSVQLLSLATGIVQVLQANAGNGKHAMFVRYPDKVELVLKVSDLVYVHMGLG